MLLPISFDTQAQTGEVLFYPRDWWHQTHNEVTPTVSITGTLVDENNYDSVSYQLDVDCHKPVKHNLITPSAELCKYYHSHCFPWWRAAFGDLEKSYVHVSDEHQLRNLSLSRVNVAGEDSKTAEVKIDAQETSVEGQFSCSRAGVFTVQETMAQETQEFYG